MTRRAWYLLAALVLLVPVAVWRVMSQPGGVHGHFGVGGASAAEVAESLANAPFSVTEIARVNLPTALAEPPAGPIGLWVVEQAGIIQRLGTSGPVVALDIHTRVSSGGETGMLGIAFHPDWPGDPRVFINYTADGKDVVTGKKRGLHSVVSSFRSADGGVSLDPSSESVVLTYDQPYSNHNSGSLQFGPDRMLYIAIGDGGSGGDPEGHGQDRSTWLGSILRVDIATPPYTVPKDNPFAPGNGAAADPTILPEIWAYGVRNPWGMHFDGDVLWFADVGQNQLEEVNRGVRGGNYGWNIKEASQCYDRPSCTGDFVEPVAEYGRALGSSVTGGVVFRDPALPGLLGKYVFADFATGHFFAVKATGGRLEKIVQSKIHPSTFGRDRAGNVYVTDYLSGAVLRMGPPA